MCDAFHDGKCVVELWTAEEWLGHFHDAIEAGRYPHEPMTRNQFLVAESDGLIDLYPQWRPATENLGYLELPATYGKAWPTFGDLFKERFFATIRSDTDLQRALRTLIAEVA